MQLSMLVPCLFAAIVPACAAPTATDAHAKPNDQPVDAAAMMQPLAPSAHHKVLEQKVGTWEATVDVPGMPDAASKAKYVAKMDHGGLWLVGDYRGEFMGASFSGQEVAGYDERKGKFVSTWVDSMMDHIMAFEGSYDEKTKTLEMFTNSFDMAGNPIQERHDSHFVDADTWVFTMNQLGADGNYAPTMTITYRRVK